MRVNITEIIGDDWYRRIEAKGRPVLRIIEHLRDTRASVRKGANVAGISRKQLKSILNDGWYDMAVDDLNRIADAICTIPVQRFSIVSARLQGWRTPPAKLQKQDIKRRKEMLRYFESHPEVDGSENVVRFLRAQLDAE